MPHPKPTGIRPVVPVFLYENNGNFFVFESLVELAQFIGPWHLSDLGEHFKSHRWNDELSYSITLSSRFIARQGGDVITQADIKDLLPKRNTWYTRYQDSRTQPAHLWRKAPVPHVSNHQGWRGCWRHLKKHQNLRLVDGFEEGVPTVRAGLRVRYKHDLHHRRDETLRNWKHYRKTQWKLKTHL